VLLLLLLLLVACKAAAARAAAAAAAVAAATAAAAAAAAAVVMMMTHNDYLVEAHAPQLTQCTQIIAACNAVAWWQQKCRRMSKSCTVYIIEHLL
jgi:hypothetical protein